jgi:hypothetical protein
MQRVTLGHTLSQFGRLLRRLDFELRHLQQNTCWIAPPKPQHRQRAPV